MLSKMKFLLFVVIQNVYYDTIQIKSAPVRLMGGGGGGGGGGGLGHNFVKPQSLAIFAGNTQKIITQKLLKSTQYLEQ